MLDIIKEIEQCKVLVNEMKDSTNPVFKRIVELTYRFTDVPMDDFHEVVKKYDAAPERSGNTFRLHISDSNTYTIFVYSVQCEISNSVRLDRHAGLDHTDLVQDDKAA